MPGLGEKRRRYRCKNCGKQRQPWWLTTITPGGKERKMGPVCSPCLVETITLSASA